MSRVSTQRRTEFHPFPVTAPEQGPSARHAYRIKAGAITAGFGAAPAQVRLEAVAPPGFRLRAAAVREGSAVKVYVTLERAANRPRARKEVLDIPFPFLPAGNYAVQYLDPRGKTVARARYAAMNPF
jgi:hypothetical protein